MKIKLKSEVSKLTDTKGEATFADSVSKIKKVKPKPNLTESELLLEAVVNGMEEVKALDIVVLDMRGLAYTMADYFVICHGGSSTQVKAIAQSVEKETLKGCNDAPWHTEGMSNAKWVLLDYINVVVHIFDKEARDYYSLEDLWADVPTRRI